MKTTQKSTLFEVLLCNWNTSISGQSDSNLGTNPGMKRSKSINNEEGKRKIKGLAVTLFRYDEIEFILFALWIEVELIRQHGHTLKIGDEPTYVASRTHRSNYTSIASN